MKNLYCLLLLIFSACTSVDELGVLVPPTVDEDTALPSQSITVAGRSRLVHVRTFGNPAHPPLFVLHGSYTDTHPYRNICESLAEKYYVVIWDQRGCGLSERITESEFTLETAVAEINAMKEMYSPNQKITLVGQSWGGGLATLYTSKHPERVAQLILIEPMPLTGADMQQLFKTIVEFNFFNTSWNNLARHSQALSPRDHAQLDYRARMILRSTMTANYHCDGNNPPEWPVHRVGGYIELVRNKRLGNPVSGFTYNFTNGLNAYLDEVLILGGSCSSLGYDMQMRYSRPHFQAAKVVEIRDAGHRMNVEQFEAVMQALRAFLNEF